MIGVFVQLNTDSRFRDVEPVGYVITESGCWDWVGFVHPGGYGRWMSYKGGECMAHRRVWVMMRGPIPNGLTLDHLCRNRRCVNPDHLEPVTMKVNNLRGENLCAKNARKTSCPSGHPYDDENTRWYQGRRYCKACALAYVQSHREHNAALKRARRKLAKQAAA